MNTTQGVETFKPYKPRHIACNEIARIVGWSVKIYTITTNVSFHSSHILKNAVSQLPKWLVDAHKMGFQTYGAAFLIVHEGLDGAWTLLCWWLGGEMLHCETYYAPYDHPSEFTLRPQEGFMACVWELAVISFEREQWISHILTRVDTPEFEMYIHTQLNAEV